MSSNVCVLNVRSICTTMIHLKEFIINNINSKEKTAPNKNVRETKSHMRLRDVQIL